MVTGLLSMTGVTIYAGETGTKKGFSIQEIEIPADKRKIISLDTTKKARVNHTWYAHDEFIDVQADTEFLKDADAEALKKTGWVAATVPGNLQEEHEVFKNKDNVWLLKRFSIRNPGNANLAINLGVISDRDSVYLNGKKIGGNGRWNSTKPQAYDKERIYSIPPGVIRYDSPNVLLVHIQRYFDKEIGITKKLTGIGTESTVNRAFYIENFSPAFFLVSYLTVSIYFLFLFLRRRQEKPYLAFGLFALFLVLYQFMRTQLKHDMGLDFLLMKRIEYVVLFALLPTFLVFLRSYFNYPENKLMKFIDRFLLGLMSIYALAILIVIMPTELSTWNTLNNNYMLPFLSPVIMLLGVTLTTYHVFKKNLDALIILLGVLFVVSAAVIDTLSHYGYFNLPRLGGYAFFTFVISIALILANHFVRLNNENEELNQNLEKKVEQRTHELNESLQQIQKLKKQQDGDYFLTSLLTEPLGRNHSKSELVGIDFLLKSKKEFTFRNWNKEIGGDINIAHSLKLKNRDVTVFLNGDAMGKSMQGAGGVLVLGSVFASIIERTRLSQSSSDVFPERWLKNTFLELHSVFESFDGSMMMSIAMGIVDDETGLLFYINAEHPWSVLYRDNKAEFIENEILYRKLGTPYAIEDVQIKVLQLMPGDAFICGSDGRDDILLEFSDTGERVINEDENLFIQHVETAEADLKKIKDQLLKQGELTDDLSLLKVTIHAKPVKAEPIDDTNRQKINRAHDLLAEKKYTEAEELLQELHKTYPQNSSILKPLTRILFALGRYKEAAGSGDRYLEKHPEDNNIMYLVSACHKRLYDFRKAIDYGERLLLRDPADLRYLVNLADCYRANKSYHRATDLIQRAEKINPENKTVIKLKKILNEKASAV